MKLQTQEQIDLKCKIFNYCIENCNRNLSKFDKKTLIVFIRSLINGKGSKEYFTYFTGLKFDEVLEVVKNEN